MVNFPIAQLPSGPGFSQSRLYIHHNQTVHQSASGRQQIHRHAGDRWQGVVTLPTLTKQQAQEWLGFLDALDGIVGSFMLPHPEFKSITGTAEDQQGTIDGAGQMGALIDTKGWDANQANIFKRGDIIQIGTALKKIVETVSANSAGKAQINVSPRFMTAPVNGETIITENAQGHFRLTDPNVAAESDAANMFTLSLPIEEVI